MTKDAPQRDYPLLEVFNGLRRIVLTEGLHAWMALLTFSRPPVTVRPDNEGIGSTLLSKLFFRPAVSREQADNTSAAAPETWGVAMDVPLKKE